MSGDPFNGYDIETETGRYGICARDNGIEVCRDGELIFTSRGAGKVVIDDTVHTGRLGSIPTGAELISEERQRHFTEEGWTLEGDSKYKDGELLRAAVEYIAAALPDRWRRLIGSMWPFAPHWMKMYKHSQLRRLVIAGSFIAAEIDRLQHITKMTISDLKQQ